MRNGISFLTQTFRLRERTLWYERYTRRGTRVAQMLTGVVPLLITLACGGDSNGPTTKTPDQLYRRLTLNHHAVTLALGTAYDTIQLVATPRMADGLPLETNESVVYTVNDPSLSVSPTGHVTALSPATNVRVLASLRIGHLTLRDSVFINVNQVPSPAPVMNTFSIQPLPGDSAKIAAAQLALITPQIRDVNGVDIQNVVVSYRSADQSIATINSQGEITANVPGHVMLYAEATVYGVKKVDSLLFTVGAPIYAFQRVFARIPVGSKTPVSFFSPETMTVGVGAVVVWQNSSEQPVDVVFDNPSAVKELPPDLAFIFTILFGLADVSVTGEGNIPTFAPEDSVGPSSGNGYRARYFPTAGTYAYRSTLYGTTGKIVVTTSDK